jgi:hypothetical protein
MTSPQAPAICPKEGVNLIPDHLCTLVLGLTLALAQAAGATATIMLIKTTTSLVQHPSKGIHPSMGTHTPWRVTTADAFIARTKAILGACRNSFFVFVSDCSKSGFAENWIQICFF